MVTDGELSALKIALAAASSDAELSEVIGAAGVLIELAAIFMFSKGMPRIEKTVIVLATLLVLGGWLGEYVSGKRADDAEAALQQVEDERVEDLRARDLRLEEQIQPRRLAPETRKKLVDAWRIFSGKKVIVRSYALDPESVVLGDQIVDALTEAGAIPVNDLASIVPVKGFSVGIIVSGPDSQTKDELELPLRDTTNLAVTELDDPKNAWPGLEVGSPEIFVGLKPIQ